MAVKWISRNLTFHENWHFVTTSSKSYFAKIHKCLMEGVVDHDQSTTAYSSFINSCRRKINVSEESDIKVFLIPGNGRQATTAISNAGTLVTHNAKEFKQIRNPKVVDCY